MHSFYSMFSSYLATAAFCSWRTWTIRPTLKCLQLIRTHRWTLARASSSATVAILRHKFTALGRRLPKACSSFSPVEIVQCSRSATRASRPLPRTPSSWGVSTACTDDHFLWNNLLKYVVCSHLADIGNACKVNLILQTILGVSLVGLAEALALGRFYCLL